MKKIFTIIFLCSVLFGWAQVPEKINFQTVLHETDGSVLPEQNVKLIINIISESENGDIAYREEHTIQSNQFGLINLQIGTGNVLYGSWEDIDWSSEEQYFMVELDPTGSGNNYVDMGITQMLSVPYALHAYESETAYIWQENENGIHYSEGNVAIGQDVAEEELVLTANSKIEVSSDQSDLAANDLVRLVMDADTAEPSIDWRDESGEYKTSITVEDFETDPMTSSKRLKLYTAGSSGARRTHLEITYEEDIADVLMYDATLIVENDFIAGDLSNPVQNLIWSDSWVNNGKKLGVGDKNWNIDGVYGNAAAEMYSNGQDNFLLLNAADETDRAQFIFRRGNAEWVAGNDELFYFKRNDSKKMKIMPDGKVKIGGNDPEFKLDVYGNINIPVGYSYLVDGGKSNGGKYAEYFESEESIETGSPVGMNIESGLVRNYQQGDVLVGVACEPTGFVANAQFAESNNHVLVGLEGLVEFNSQKSQISDQQVFTADGKKIGTLIENKVLLK